MAKRTKKDVKPDRTANIKRIFWVWMDRIGAPTDCGYCNNMILIFKLIAFIWIFMMAQTFMENIDKAAHDECIVKYKKVQEMMNFGETVVLHDNNHPIINRNFTMSDLMEDARATISNMSQNMI